MRIDPRLLLLLAAASAPLLVACGSASKTSESGTTTSSGSTATAGGAGSAGGTGGLAAGTGGGPAAGTGGNPAAGTGGSAPAVCPGLEAAGSPASEWVYVDNHKLAYKTLPRGDRILDFSYAGYMGGGVALPTVPVKATVMPSSGDDTAAIQAAINQVSKLPVSSGVRGAVLLGPGTFQLAGSLAIGASGVVLRGSGSGANGTTLDVTGSPRTAITIEGTGSWQAVGTPAAITDAYVPSGASSFHVAGTAGLAVGASVTVDRPVTAAWIDFMGMSTLVRDGGAETWIAAGTVGRTDRVITAITGDEVTLDAPLSDSIDTAYITGATVSPYTFAGRIEQVGIESLHIVAPMLVAPLSSPTFELLEMSAVANAWVKDVAGDEFENGFTVGSTAKWVTIVDSSMTRTAAIDGSAGYPFHYSIAGQETLVLRCTSSGDNVFSYATQALTPGPNVALGLSATGTPTNAQPHQRWATGLLLDGLTSPTGGISLMNRGYDGSGHGWAIGWGVVWNSVADTLLIQQPPGTENWAIGTTGKLTTAAAPGSTTILPQGIIDSPGAAVGPSSLYLTQLCERLGPQALTAIGE